MYQSFHRVLVILVLILAAVCPAQAQSPPTGVQITLADGTRALRHVVTVPASLDDVWSAWTTEDGVRRFLGVGSSIELRAGGSYEFYFVPDAPEGERGGEGNTVLAYLPQRMLSFTWNAPPTLADVRDERTIVVLEFDEIAPGAVRVTLTHHDFGAGGQWDDAYAYFTRAWGGVLTALRNHFVQLSSKSAETFTTGREPWRRGWIYVIEPVREGAAMEPTPEEARLFSEHFRYLQSLTQKGTVILAGPVIDMALPGVVIFYADDQQEAQSIMENDPGVKNGLFKASVHPIALSLLRERDLQQP
ncbi:MAG: SRPBCC domain-containing protein [Planctomycetota bacterium]